MAKADPTRLESLDAEVIRACKGKQPQGIQPRASGRNVAQAISEAQHKIVNL